MNKNDRNEAYKTFLNAWGEKAQIMMCVEEMSELTKALCKYMRFKKHGIDDELDYNIKEEIADVYNMINQLKMIFGEDKIEKIADMKIERTLKKIADKK